MTNFSIITPTYPNPYWRLPQVAKILQPQLRPGDEWLVLADGPMDDAQRLVDGMQQVEYLECPQTRRNGNLQRDLGIEHARPGNWLVFYDDSILPKPNALELMRNALEGDRPHFFRMDLYKPDGSWWFRKWDVPDLSLEARQVTGGIFVPRNIEGKIGKWEFELGRERRLDIMKRRGHEHLHAHVMEYPIERIASWFFIESTLARFPEGPVWREEIILDWFE